MARLKHRWMIFVFILGLFLVGCTLDEVIQVQYGSLVGTWKLKKSSAGLSKLTFLRDGVYEFDIDGDGAIDVGGRYEVLFNNQLKLQDEEGEIAPECTEPGIYKYRINSRGLKFYLLGDQCFARSNLFHETWVRVQP